MSEERDEGQRVEGGGVGEKVTGEDYPPQSPPPVQWSPRGRCVLPGRWNHLSSRTVEGRYAFAPVHEDFTRRIWAIVGVGMRRYDVEVAFFVLMSNHLHCIARAKRPGALSYFMQWLKARSAELSHELNGTRGQVWEKGFSNTNLLDDEAEVGWLRYALSHGIKEGICRRPEEWPGPHAVQAVCEGEAIQGAWFDRRRWQKAGRPEDRGPFMVPVEVPLTPLSAWAGGPKEAWHRACREIRDDLLVQYAEREVLGVEAALSRGPQYRPEHLKYSRTYVFDARGESRKELLREAYAARRQNLEAYHRLMRRLMQAGHRAVMVKGDGQMPEGHDWTRVLADAVEDRPIVGHFFPRPTPPKPPPDAADEAWF